MTAERAPGQPLGPYRLVKPLGQGSVGEVWEAVLRGPAGFEKAVALKLLRAGPASETLREILLREARLGALLQHPNVVSTLQLTEHDGTWCLALELVRGLAVDALCAQAGGRLGPAAVLDVGIQAAAGLHHVHRFRADGVDVGLVHRDVKPANLLVDRTGVVKLADLGICVLHGDAGRPAGTPGYMAPEQAVGEPEPRSDLFSLGATLYFLATGERPFGRGLEALHAVRNVERELDSPRFLAPVEAAVAGLAEVVRWCLRYDPGDRPASARTLADALLALRPNQPPGPTLLDALAQASPELAPGVTWTPTSEAPTRRIVAGNLRPPRDAFVGRAAELAEIEALVTPARWVVLVGPGGAGKTRLAVEVARRARSGFPGHAWAFDLTAARTPSEVCGVVAASLGLELDAPDPVAHVGRVFAAKGRALVLLDNLEQCVAALPDTVGRWLDLAPDTTFLGTSRVVPALAGERTLVLGDLLPEDAVGLLVARAPRPLTTVEREAAPDLCRALDHLPLPIELAAARLRVLDVPTIRARLSLALLADTRGERPARHRSVLASLRWSWELLSPVARAAFAQLSVFVGPFELAAAEAVVDLRALSGRPWAIEALQELSDASLLLVEVATGRFRMRVVVREFASKLLADADRLRAEHRHGEHYARRGTPEALAAYDRHGGFDRMRVLGEELDDVMVACRRAVARGEASVAVGTLAASTVVLSGRGPTPLALELASSVLAMGLTDPRERSLAARLTAALLRMVGRAEEAVALHEEAVAAAREAGDRTLEALARCLQVVARMDLMVPTAETHLHLAEALALARALGERRFEGMLLGNLATLLRRDRRIAEAQATYERALALHREVGNLRWEAIVLSNYAMFLRGLGRCDDAGAALQQALAIHREMGDTRWEGGALNVLAELHRIEGRLEEARGLYQTALALNRELGSPKGEADTHAGLGNLYLLLGREADARVHHEHALDLVRSFGDRRREGSTLCNLGNVHLQEGDRRRARACYEEALKVHRSVANRYSEATVLANLARLSGYEGRRDEAARLFAEAFRAHCETGNRRGEGGVLVDLAKVALDAGSPADGLAFAERAEAVCREIGFPAGEAEALAYAARALAALGRAAAADERLAAAESLLRAGHWPESDAAVAIARAEVRIAAGDPDGARRALAGAIEAAGWHPEVRAEVERVRAHSDCMP